MGLLPVYYRGKAGGLNIGEASELQAPYMIISFQQLFSDGRKKKNTLQDILGHARPEIFSYADNANRHETFLKVFVSD